LRIGIALAAAGIVLTVFSADVLMGLGSQTTGTGILGVEGILSRIAMFFGLSLAAGFICLGVAFGFLLAPIEVLRSTTDRECMRSGLPVSELISFSW
jgi:hypothetical protein